MFALASSCEYVSRVQNIVLIRSYPSNNLYIICSVYVPYIWRIYEHNERGHYLYRKSAIFPIWHPHIIHTWSKYKIPYKIHICSHIWERICCHVCMSYMLSYMIVPYGGGGYWETVWRKSNATLTFDLEKVTKCQKLMTTVSQPNEKISLENRWAVWKWVSKGTEGTSMEFWETKMAAER